MISSHVKISMISLRSSLSLKLYLNSSVFHRNIFGSSSKVFGNPRESSDICGNFRKFSENVGERSSGIRDDFGKSSGIFGKWSEIFGKSSKPACHHWLLYNKKRTLHVSSKIWIYVLVARTIYHSFAALTREILFLKLEQKIHIFSPPCNILYIIFNKCSGAESRHITFLKEIWESPRAKEVVVGGVWTYDLRIRSSDALLTELPGSHTIYIYIT